MFLLRCPGCGQEMKYQPAKALKGSSSKRCVYCGKSFRVKERIVRGL